MKLMCRLIAFLFLLYLSCAHQVPPAGGPKDDLSPKIVKTIPEIGALNHPVNRKIEFYFSEWIDLRNVKKSITVFPTLPGGFKVTVTGRRVEIEPKKAFADSTTYHVGINTELADYHSVSIGTPYSFFFSTGPSIDKAVVYGCVIETEKKNLQPKVALFRCENGALPDTAFLNLPSYLVQTDSAGFFNFMHIRKGRYTILAFVDNDNDNCITPGKEDAFALPEREFLLGDEAGPLMLFPVYSDTTPLKAATIKAISAKVISGEWNEAPQKVNTEKDFLWKILSLDSLIKAPRISEFIQVSGSRKFALRLSDSLTTGSYSLIYRIYPRILSFTDDSIRKQKEPFLDTIRFNGTVFSDTIKPVFKGSSPIYNADLNTKITIAWSKPVKPLYHKWFIADTLGDTVILSIDTVFGDTTTFLPERRLLPGRYYTMIMLSSYFRDFTGNSPAGTVKMPKKENPKDGKPQKDSIGIIYIKFTTILPKDLCYSLCGSAPCLEQNSLRIWQFKPFGLDIIYTAEDSLSNFCFDSIQGVKGRIGFFVDNNGDKEHTFGSMFPWNPPEPCFVFPDTIEARSRWDIEGIVAPACDVCSKVKKQAGKKADTLSTDTGNTKERQ